MYLGCSVISTAFSVCQPVDLFKGLLIFKHQAG